MKKWDIFCRVIDNYGDIGVCWRLARQLANEHTLEVRLWVDDIAALKHIWPTTVIAPAQVVDAVTVKIWREEFSTDYVADVVIEAFACHIPDHYLQQMTHTSPAPQWINLEYLSAESWVEGCHQLTSIHPQNGLKKTFFFPGFAEKTGGLLREKNLLELRDEFTLSLEKSVFLNPLGLANWPSNGLLVSLFSYENPALEHLLCCFSQSSLPIICFVPEGKALSYINNHLNLKLKKGDSYTKNSLTLNAIPFLTQTDYDKLLWACDINFVRGEDSFVRAQWAAKPFIWHIYPQDEDAHLVKLNAFLKIYTEHMAPALAELITRLWHEWNTGEDGSEHWNKILSHYQEWHSHNQGWCKTLEQRTDLASSLVHFCQKKL
jgi:uncharacterized repeat protein (TIGR03837 family)